MKHERTKYVQSTNRCWYRTTPPGSGIDEVTSTLVFISHNPILDSSMIFWSLLICISKRISHIHGHPLDLMIFSKKKYAVFFFPPYINIWGYFLTTVVADLNIPTNHSGTILYYTILYYTILYYTILYYTILYYTILYYTILLVVTYRT